MCHGEASPAQFGSREFGSVRNKRADTDFNLYDSVRSVEPKQIDMNMVYHSTSYLGTIIV
jgi:hypothetical protein